MPKHDKGKEYCIMYTTHRSRIMQCPATHSHNSSMTVSSQ